ncbi:C-type lectin domain family 6 member A-like [Molossus molossus]|uniref:C-type lectin domain containing 6A n=1 Tax=Molossus molossus TaxID=27622 RepID=A0A7J8FW45_MOLMO|nr:C-type lectin domain family 6 member A-like [Molossus molossus]KAF6452013.1 C-type lectin domain containing 6A [Molossus molossus]
MVQKEQRQGREKAVWWPQVKIWSVAVISIALLSACFIVSCVVTYDFTYVKTNKRLSELHTYHSGLTCFSEETRATEKVWGCCPSTWKYFGSSCYFISNEQTFWTKSEQNCVVMGAHLVVINTKAEQNFIVQHLNKSLSYFLGLSDPQKNNNWQWIDHTPYAENFRLWHQGEPNLSEEDCASLVFWSPGGWGWNDVFCNSQRHSICEMKKVNL